MFGGPRLYRYYNYENAQYLEAPTGGWAPDINPWELAPNQAQILDNFIPRPGSVVMRGSLAVSIACNDTNHAISPIGLVLGDTTFGHWGLLTNKLPSIPGPAGYMDYWNAPLLKPGSSAPLATGVSSVAAPIGRPRWCILDNSPSAVVPGANLNCVPGPRYINFDGLIYGITYDAQGNGGATATDANSNYTIWKTCLYTMPALQSAFTQPTIRTSAPQGAFDIKGYQSRIWLIGGIDVPGGLTAHEPSTLFFTNPISSGGGVTTADWKDPTSGAVNKLVMDRNNDDYGVGLASIRNGLIIFRHSSVWILRGNTTQNYTLQMLSNEVGCIDARTIVEVDGGVYWLSHMGLVFSNGVSVQVVQSAAQMFLHQAIQWTFGNGNFAPNSPSASAALLSDGSILISVALQTPNASDWATEPVWSAVYRPGNPGTWWQLTSFAFQNGNSAQFPNQLASLVVGRRSTYQIYALDDRSIIRVEDRVKGSSILLPESVLNTGVSYYDNLSWASPFPASYIPAMWRSKYVDVVTASRRRTGAMKRCFLDHALVALASPDNHAFSVTMKNSHDQALISQQSTNLTTTTTSRFGSQLGFNQAQPFTPALIRENIDVDKEIDDVYFDVSYVGQTNIGTSPSSSAASGTVYGLGVEWQQTGDLRTRT